VFDVAWLELDLIRLLAAFHPAVGINAAVLDTCHKYHSSLTNSFRQGYPVREQWRHLYACEINPKMLAGLNDRDWDEQGDYFRETLHDVGSRTARGPAAHIRVRGPREQVQSFRANLLAGEMKHSACFLDDWAENDLIVRLRTATGAKSFARAWSRTQPALEVDVVVTDPISERSHQRFIAGKSMAARTIEIARDELLDTFLHRTAFWAGGIA
jgi:hypothetical protein